MSAVVPLPQHLVYWTSVEETQCSLSFNWASQFLAQCLTDLRDKIFCASDHIVPGDHSNQPDLSSEAKARVCINQSISQSVCQLVSQSVSKPASQPASQPPSPLLTALIPSWQIITVHHSHPHRCTLALAFCTLFCQPPSHLAAVQ